MKLKYCLKHPITLITLSLALLSITINVNAKDIEYEQKQFHNFIFVTPNDDLTKKTINNRPAPTGINSKVAVLSDNSYRISTKDSSQIVTDQNNFELSYSLSPVIANSNPKEQVMCYSNLNVKNIDDRYYSVPYFEFAPINPAGIIQAGNLKIIENKYLIIPGEALLTDINFKTEDSYLYRI